MHDDAEKISLKKKEKFFCLKFTQSPECSVLIACSFVYDFWFQGNSSEYERFFEEFYKVERPDVNFMIFRRRRLLFIAFLLCLRTLEKKTLVLP